MGDDELSFPKETVDPYIMVTIPIVLHKLYCFHFNLLFYFHFILKFWYQILFVLCLVVCVSQ
jgi:hypothetical protein